MLKMFKLSSIEMVLETIAIFPVLLDHRPHRAETEKAMAPHCSTLVWKIPWTEETGRLQSMGSLRVGHD